MVWRLANVASSQGVRGGVPSVYYKESISSHGEINEQLYNVDWGGGLQIKIETVLNIKSKRCQLLILNSIYLIKAI